MNNNHWRESCFSSSLAEESVLDARSGVLLYGCVQKEQAVRKQKKVDTETILLTAVWAKLPVLLDDHKGRQMLAP